VIILRLTLLPLLPTLLRLRLLLRRRRRRGSGVTDGAQGYSLTEHFAFNFLSRYFSSALQAAGSGERAVALNDSVDPCFGFESINILGIILAGEGRVQISFSDGGVYHDIATYSEELRGGHCQPGGRPRKRGGDFVPFLGLL
jgi:hypothetical protein